MASSLTHLDAQSNPCMVDVSAKAVSSRRARAEAWIALPPSVVALFDGKDLVSAKGAVFATASLAGIMAAKRTGELIPLCHPLGLDDCRVCCELRGSEVRIEAEVAVSGRTGVEMEAMTAASVAALTVYDMCKAASHGIEIRSIRLLSKIGGKQDWHAEARNP
jgi:cyclic pyranopterin phosphate synthase